MKQQQDLDNSFIAEALPAFISEAQEQLEMLEQLLLQLEDAPQDSELLGALFRCAHTVKGSAGIFGLDEVVAFTHYVETLLGPAGDTLAPSLIDELCARTEGWAAGLVLAGRRTAEAWAAARGRSRIRRSCCACRQPAVTTRPMRLLRRKPAHRPRHSLRACADGTCG